MSLQTRLYSKTVTDVINLLKHIEVDVETMHYILKELQLEKQLIQHIQNIENKTQYEKITSYNAKPDQLPG